jgi:zinc protease
MVRLASLIVILLGFIPFAHAAPSVGDIDFQTQTLDNGLRVIYAPLHTAPVVHVRVLYHVGSRDERPDRQGFAHMFEHMMFRGSAHVKPEEHMKLVGGTGGYSNAYTSFDQTVYFETLPSSHLAMALYLEADRMASFKVSDDIYKTERKVVAEEWRMRQNQPYGSVYEELLKTVFTKHSYRWTPIGDMDDLRAAPASELQAFFNKYYVPNNAVLVIAGDIDVAKTKEMVKQSFGWIPKGPDIQRDIPAEPPQEQARRRISPENVPLPAVLLAWRLPPYVNPDNDALDLLAAILGNGASSRLDQRLVNNASPLAVDVGASTMTLEDGGIFTIQATVLQGKTTAAVESALADELKRLHTSGVTADELNKVKVQARMSLLQGRLTDDALASQLGNEAILSGDPGRVNTQLERIDKVTVDDINRVARQYLTATGQTTLIIKPDPLNTAARASATEASAIATAPVAPSTTPVAPRAVEFPAGYPTQPPTATLPAGRAFEKGTEFDVQGVRVIVMPDHRLPLVNWGLTIRRGGYTTAADQWGLADLTTSLMEHGTKKQSYAEFSRDLASRAISINVADGGDITTINGSTTSDQFAYGIGRMHEVLTEPLLSADEFAKLKAQTLGGLQIDLERPSSVASRELSEVLYGPSPLGRSATPASVGNVTLEDVEAYYKSTFVPQGAILVFAGDLTVDEAKVEAERLLDGWADGRVGLPAPLDYSPQAAAEEKFTLVDRPSGQQATIRMGELAYDIHSDDKYAGSVAGWILSGGIDGRMMKYVRAEKGLVYDARGSFSPNRHGGEFIATASTADATAGDAIEAMRTVLQRMRTEPVTSEELADAKMRVAGGMLLQVQTIFQQARYRVDGILNGYPIDYFDTYPQRIAQVTAQQVQAVMEKYADPDKMKIVVVAPAATVEDQLKKLGDVRTIPMPNQRAGGGAKPVGEGATQPTER